MTAERRAALTAREPGDERAVSTDLKRRGRDAAWERGLPADAARARDRIHPFRVAGVHRAVTPERDVLGPERARERNGARHPIRMAAPEHEHAVVQLVEQPDRPVARHVER